MAAIGTLADVGEFVGRRVVQPEPDHVARSAAIRHLQPEIAARLDVPIGVVRVVVADLAHRGAVQISEPPSDVPASLEGYTYTTLLQKVLDGIKSL